MSYHSGFQMAFCLALLCITFGFVKSGSRRKKRKAEIHSPHQKIYIYIIKRQEKCNNNEDAYLCAFLCFLPQRGTVPIANYYKRDYIHSVLEG